MKKELFGEDYGFPVDSIYYEFSNSNLRKEYYNCLSKFSEDGPLIVDEIFRRCGNLKYFRAFLNGIDFDEEDRDSLKLLEISKKMKLNYENIFESQEIKRYLLKNKIHYSALISHKDKMTKEIIYEPIKSCKGERIGRVFQRICRKGKKLEEIIKSS